MAYGLRMVPMRAMILAAGLGTRLRPLTDTTPKPLLPLDGQPLIVWNLLLLRRHGIRDVIINLHYLGEQIERALGDGARFGVKIAYSHEPVALGTGGGIKQVEPFFGGEPFLVLNGDTLLELDLAAVMERYEQSRALALMVVREDPDVDRWGAVELDRAQCIVRIVGRGRDAVGPLVKRMFAGVHVMHPKLLRDIPTGKASSIIEAYVAAIQAGERIVGYDMHGYWSDVGTPDRYAQAQRDARGKVIDLSKRWQDNQNS